MSLFGLIDSYSETPLSLDEFCKIKNPSTFLFRADSQAMAPRIIKGDILIISRELKPLSGNLIICDFQGVRLFRLYYPTTLGIHLRGLNPETKAIFIEPGSELSLFGVVTHHLSGKTRWAI